MIKFFRNIRKKLLVENRFNKYLMYAIGEIILVVIGILIALQINTWNEDRKERTQSLAFVKDLHKDLQTDTLKFNDAMRKLESLIEKNMIVLSKPRHERYSDTIWQAIYSGYYHTSINPRTFQKIQNSGRTTLLGYEALYDDLSFYYTVEYEDLERYLAYDYQRWETISQKFKKVNPEETEIFESKLNNWLDQFPEMQMSGYQQAVLTDSDNRQSNLDFVNSVAGRNILTNNVRRSSLMWDKYRVKREAAIKLMQAIDSTLKHK